MSSQSTATLVAETDAPLLRSRNGSAESTASSSWTAQPSNLAVLLGRVTGRHGPSMLVRETAARELEQRRVNWGYSKPVVAVDIMWNSVFVVVSIAMLVLTNNERPNTPIRLWICGYALQCLVHVVLVWLEYRRRNLTRIRRNQDWSEIGGAGNETEEEEEDGMRDEVALARSRYLLLCSL